MRADLCARPCAELPRLLMELPIGGGRPGLVFWVYRGEYGEALAVLAEVVHVPCQFLYAPLEWTCL